MTEPKKRNSTSLMLLLLYALLIASLLVLTLAGAWLYSDTMDARDAHAKQRSALSYIQSQTAACGGKGNIRLIDGPEGPAVCLREPESDFETRIYLYENALRTEFSGRSPAPFKYASASESQSCPAFSQAYSTSTCSP